MSAIIYETINLYNKEKNILPYRYLGSDQNNKPNYLGSNKELKNDIKRLGHSFFKKKILFEFKYDISNILLRKLESEIQKLINVASNTQFYNKTNSSLVGYIETKEEKKIRMDKVKKAHNYWWDNLSDDKKNYIIKRASNNIINYNKSTKGKKYDEIFGKKKALQKIEKHTGKNNGMSKQILDLKTGKIFYTMKDAMFFYDIKKYETIKKICEKGIKLKFI
jgi:hypothetical protein